MSALTVMTFVHLFQWSWKDVSRECERRARSLAASYQAVLVSPPAEHVLLKGTPWYESYQPVSYRLESRLGSREEFAAMVASCRANGVRVYVDAVINHMAYVLAEGTSRKGFAGTTYTRYRYGDLYAPSDFHRCGRNGDDSVRNYEDRLEVQQCNLLGLADLDTGQVKVREKIARYLNDLVSLGVSGFRIDAAKHIDATELGLILKQIKGSPFIFQEVAEVQREPIRAREYFGNGFVTEFRYGPMVSHALRSGEVFRLLDVGRRLMPSDRAIVFIDNHDTQRADPSVLTYKDGALYELANIFMLAWPYGTPMLMSGYDFERPEEGAPGKGWVYEHRWPKIALMARFREVMGTAPLERVWTDGRQLIGFARGSRGFVAINGGKAPVVREFETGLAPGSYRDVLSRKTVEVSTDGRAVLSLGALDAVALVRGP